jgi:hypothetical protein
MMLQLMEVSMNDMMGQMRMPDGKVGMGMAENMMGENKKNLLMLMKMKKRNGYSEAGEQEAASPEMMHKLMNEFKMMSGIMK